MEKKRNTTYRQGSLILLLIASLILHVVQFDFGNRNNYKNEYVYDSTLLVKTVNDSLPHYAWKRITDSLHHIGSFRKSNQEGTGNSTSFVSVGYGKYSHCDTCSSASSRNKEARTTSYYFLLNGYKLDYNSEFSLVNGKSMLKYPVWDSTENSTRIGHYEKKELKIRFQDNNYKKKEAERDKPGAVLLPVSKITYTILSVLITLLFILGSLFAIYIVVVLPFATLVGIATGTIFTKRNIKNLSIMGWSFIAIFFFFPLTGLLFSLLFNSVIPKEIHFPFWESLFSNTSLLIAGVIILLLANAFKSGYQLQQEQDLTV